MIRVLPRPLCAKTLTMRRATPQRVAQRPRAPRALGGLEEVSYYVGKSIILFTAFYCSLNWMHYRNLRKKHEEHKDKE